MKEAASSPKQRQPRKENAVLSSFLKLVLPLLPLQERPKSWRIRLWQLCCGGKHGSAIAMVAATGSFLKAVLDSPDLNWRIMALMDVALMLGTVFYQVTFTNRRANTLKMVEDLVVLAQELEWDASGPELALLRGTVRGMRQTRNVTAFFVVTIPTLMIVSPMLTGELTMSFYPVPTGAFWYFVCLCQTIGTVTCPLCVNAIIFSLLLVSHGSAALVNCIGIRMETCRGEKEYLRLVHAHRRLTDVGNLMAATYYPTLFCLITGLLSTTLMGTYKLTTGIFDGYTAMIVPGALLFFFNITNISDTLAIATENVGDAVWGSPWTEESIPVRRMVLNMMTRAQRPSAARVPLLNNVDLPAFRAAMNQWYSFLQLIRSLNG